MVENFRWKWSIFELPCPWDKNIERSHAFKEEKYAPLSADLSNTFKVFTFSVEVSARGRVTANNCARLKALAYRCCRGAKIVTNSLITNGSKATLLTSFSIFSARNEPSWIDPPPLIARWCFIFIAMTSILLLFKVRINWRSVSGDLLPLLQNP